MRVPRKESEKARIEVIPMIDIIFSCWFFHALDPLDDDQPRLAGQPPQSGFVAARPCVRVLISR
jgi:hypothetical protein